MVGLTLFFGIILVLYLGMSLSIFHDLRSKVKVTKNTNAKVAVFQQNNENLMFFTYQTIHRTTKKNNMKEIEKQNSKLEAFFQCIGVITLQLNLNTIFLMLISGELSNPLPR